MAKRKNRLAEDEERFVEEYLIDRHGTNAYIRANPGTRRTTACEMASRLLSKSNIQRAIELGRKAISQRTNVSADRVVKQYARIAFADIGQAFDLSKSVPVLLAPRDIPFDTRQAITAIKLKRRVLKNEGSEDYEIEEWEYKFADKLSALDKLSKHLGLYKELPPLDAVLMLLPESLRESVRSAIAQAISQGSSPGSDRPDQQELPAAKPDSRQTPSGPNPPVPGDGVAGGPVAGGVPQEHGTPGIAPLFSAGGQEHGDSGTPDP